MKERERGRERGRGEGERALPPDVCADIQGAILQGSIHGEEEGVGVQTCVVLVDEHRVHGNITNGGIPAAETRVEQHCEYPLLSDNASS